MRSEPVAWPRLSRLTFTVLVVAVAVAQTVADALLSWPRDPLLAHPGWYVLRCLYLSFPWLWLGQDLIEQLLALCTWGLALSLLNLLVLLRLKTLAWPLYWTAFLIVPGVHLFFLLTLCLASDKPQQANARRTAPDVPEWIRVIETQLESSKGGAHTTSDISEGHNDEGWPPPLPYRRSLYYALDTLSGHYRTLTVAAGMILTLGVVMVLIATAFYGHYGWTLFVGVPMILGWWLTLLIRSQKDAPLGDCYLVCCLMMLVGGGVLFVIGAEGMVCLLMAAPIVFVSGLTGCALAYWMTQQWHLDARRSWYCGALVPVCLALLGAESTWPLPKLERAVSTEIVVEAPPERVWQTVIAFPSLTEPKELLFRLGAAYPVAAEIHGEGVGAVRHCIFNTGTFVEPIEVWDPPRCLRFAVTDQPAVMRELSPWDIHPPHLHGYLVCRQGEFRLEALGDGKTRLVGTTWYSNAMWPQAYWGLWSDYCIHAIHYRVLKHIKSLAEQTPTH